MNLRPTTSVWWLLLLSLVFWFFPFGAEGRQAFLPEFVWAIYFIGIISTSIIIGVIAPWRKAYLVFLLLVAPVCSLAIRPQMLLPITVAFSAVLCVFGYGVGRIASAVYHRYFTQRAEANGRLE